MTVIRREEHLGVCLWLIGAAKLEGTQPKADLALIDFGNVQKLTKKQRIGIAKLLIGMAEYNTLEKGKNDQEILNNIAAACIECGMESTNNDIDFLASQALMFFDMRLDTELLDRFDIPYNMLLWQQRFNEMDEWKIFPAAFFNLQRCLQLLVQSSLCKVSGVVTAPSAFQISYNPKGVTNVLHADIPSFCNLCEIDVSVIKTGMNDLQLFEKVKKWKPDAFVVVGWYHMIPEIWRDLAPAFGMHASLLPNYSGGAPLVWAMINGESTTGITFFKMDEGVDSGPIVGQFPEPIYSDDTIATLYGRIEERGLQLLSRFLPDLAEGNLSLTDQNEDNRRVFPQRSPSDGRIKWESGANEVERFIRAQTRPYPGAFTSINDERLIVWSAKLTNNQCRKEPGSISRVGDKILITTGTDQLQLEELSFQGKDYKSAEIAHLSGGDCQRLGIVLEEKI